MRFGPVAVVEAAGAVLAHSVRRGKLSLKKGRVLSAADLEALAAAGLEQVIAARLDPDDVPEDRAAAAIAHALAGPGTTETAPFTGRANLVAAASGVVTVDRERLDALNLVDEAVTAATVPPFGVVEPRQLVATVKIIPFAVPRAVLDRCLALIDRPLVTLHPFRPRTVALIQTVLPGTKPSVLDGTVEVTRARLAASAATLVHDARCPHEAVAVAAAIEALPPVDLVLIAGASAVVDRRDVLPAGIEAAGGTVHHFGMPVDPGNLLLLAERHGKPVLGLPGCARSPKLNGADWVLQRLCADLPVTRTDVMRMGSGGLLMEIAARGQAREPPPRAPRISGLVLAAGRSSRMGRNKLTLTLDGVPLVRRVVDELAAAADEVVVVIGHDAEAVAAALAGAPARLVHNPDYAEGLSTSLRAGLAALSPDADGVLVCLGDMPRIRRDDLARLIAGFNPVEGRTIILPTFEGRRGNPVLWGRRWFPAMAAVTGDKGARSLIEAQADQVAEVAIGHDGVLIDVDTPDAYAALTEAVP